MNREIKFRGKRTDNGEWVYGYYVIDPKGQHKIYWQPFAESTSNTYHIVDPKSVGQLVGIENEHGFSVYEGDIIHSDQWKPTTYQVCYDRGAFYIAGADRHEVADIKYAEQFKVIGNTTDNPELLTTTL